MKKIIWQIKYALTVKRKAATTWSFAWEAAYIATNDWLQDDWREWCPEDAAWEEMSYWD